MNFHRIAEHCARVNGDESNIIPDHEIDFGNDKVIITYDEELTAVVIAIRGSDRDYRDWRSNFRFIRKRTKFGRCHRGFYNSAEKMLEKIETILKEYHPWIKTYIAAYSRGGGIGIPLAEIINRKVRLITFGSPRAFKKGLKLSTETDRFHNEGDPVTKLPWKWMGFAHYGEGHGLNGDTHNFKDYQKRIPAETEIEQRRR